jgi:hypothetical protein
MISKIKFHWSSYHKILMSWLMIYIYFLKPICITQYNKNQYFWKKIEKISWKEFFPRSFSQSLNLDKKWHFFFDSALIWVNYRIWSAICMYVREKSKKIHFLSKFGPGVANPNATRTRTESQWFFNILDDFPWFAQKFDIFGNIFSMQPRDQFGLATPDIDFETNPYSFKAIRYLWSLQKMLDLDNSLRKPSFSFLINSSFW